eukprot:TRINITY_DN18627_c0_g1_i1.p1 TRINITY_DN18627_c0_g1~~TRINITY_DN18627_c0_g1_i1.p1  ORF type:complete len:986 (-),score=207.83 TRINITY_DN18627_c0_g1_i1:186-3143(-)
MFTNNDLKEIRTASIALEATVNRHDPFDPDTWPQRGPYPKGNYVFVSKEYPNSKLRLKNAASDDPRVCADPISASPGLARFKLYGTDGPWMVFVSRHDKHMRLRVHEDGAVTMDCGAFDDHAFHFRLSELPTFPGAVMIINRLPQGLTLMVTPDGSVSSSTEVAGQSAVWTMLGPLRDDADSMWEDADEEVGSHARTGHLYLINVPLFENKLNPQYPLGKYVTKVLGEVNKDGIFMHAMATRTDQTVSASWLTKGKATKFTATVSIDDTAVTEDGRVGEISCGALTFAVVGKGGKELWRSTPVQNQSDTQSVSVDLTGSSFVTLKVISTDGDKGAHAVWLQPKLTLVDCNPLTKQSVFEGQPHQIDRLPTYTSTITYVEPGLMYANDRHRIMKLAANHIRMFRTYQEPTWKEINLDGAEFHFDEEHGRRFLIEERGCDEPHEFYASTEAEACKWFCVIFASMAFSDRSRPQEVPDHLFQKVPTSPWDWLDNQSCWVSNDPDRRSQSDGDSIKHLVDRGEDCSLYWKSCCTQQNEHGEFSKPQWIIFDLQVATELAQFKYYTRDGSDHISSCPRECSLLYADKVDNNSKWAIASRWHSVKKGGWSPTVSFEPRVARFWKLVINSTFGHHSEGAVLVRVRFYGSQLHQGRSASLASLTSDADACEQQQAQEIFHMMTGGGDRLTKDNFREFIQRMLANQGHHMQGGAHQAKHEDLKRRSSALLDDSSDEEPWDSEEDEPPGAAESSSDPSSPTSRSRVVDDGSPQTSSSRAMAQSHKQWDRETSFHANLIQTQATDTLRRVMQARLQPNAVLIHTDPQLQEHLAAAVIPHISEWHKSGGTEQFVDPKIHFQALEDLSLGDKDIGFPVAWTPSPSRQIRLVLELASRHSERWDGRRYLLLCVPTVPSWISSYVQQHAPGLMSTMAIHALEVPLCPLDRDILSMSRLDVARLVTRAGTSFHKHRSNSDMVHRRLLKDGLEVMDLSLIHI